jgi:hypothetical protein
MSFAFGRNCAPTAGRLTRRRCGKPSFAIRALLEARAMQRAIQIGGASSIAPARPERRLSLLRATLHGWPRGAWQHYDRQRGILPSHDVVVRDGRPFEAAKPEEVFAFCRRAGFELRNLTARGGGLGCNQRVFVACAFAS